MWLRARGSRKASLVGTWNNAVKAAGRGDFSLIDAFPRNIFIDGVRLATSHYEVSRIAAAAAESEQPFEDIYALVGAA
jgi:recombinational DNA repair protein (RecF pathway)